MTTPAVPRSRPGARRRAEAGYALLLVIFFAALVLIVATSAAPSFLTQGRREREEEMIWRGQQYVRAIRLYYRKNGRFPQTVEDLTEKRTPTRYLRKAYADPMNREDGSWRFIYVGPAGQLVGSLTRTAAIQVPVVAPATGTPAGGAQPRPGPGPAPSPQPAPLPPASGASGPVIGGNIIGVGSKVARASIKAYNGKLTYREWEFIWDPAADLGVIGAPGGPARPGQQEPQTPTPRS